MLRSSCLAVFLLSATAIGLAQQTEASVPNGTFVPAGTLMDCTLEERDFSSRTAQVGDPVLCHVNSVEMFGRPLIPRGAYLSARLQEYRDPGHFFGKGWLQLAFTSLTLPAGNFPLNAKVISAGHYRVNGEGKVQGGGHPVRDAVEWTIPVLWPIKVLTLPARGPRPTFKGETRIELRLMEDMLFPESPSSTAQGLNSTSSALLPRRGASTASLPDSLSGERLLSRDASVPPQQVVPVPEASIPRERSQSTSATNQTQASAANVTHSVPNPVVISPALLQLSEAPPPPPAFDAEAVFSIVTNDLVIHYATLLWIDGDKIRFFTPNGNSDQLLRASISRDLTYRANVGKNLKAWLP